jgi:UDPglucose 6-dehydrogenase
MGRYSVVGLGKLGASMAAAIASRGHAVVGVDVNEDSVRRVNAGQAPVQETNLAETIAANHARLRATTNVADAIANSDVTFVVVPTPSEKSGAFSLRYAAAACRSIGEALADKDAYHLVVMSSTVLPGSMRYGLLPLLEETSGKQAGVDFGVCYSPEFIALGSVIRDFLNPDFTLVGELDTRSGDALESAYAEIMANHARCQRMSLENAELAKVAVNTYVTTKITFANMLAEICERIPGGDIDVVSAALGMDSRIGRKYLTGAIGYGGPCFPRDNVALSYLANAVGAQATLAETTDAFNRGLAERLAERLGRIADNGSRVAVLGLAYKPFSHVVEESQGMMLARALAARGFAVSAHDPLAGESARAVLPPGIDVTDSLNDAIANADVVIITTPDPVYAGLTPTHFERNGDTITVVDFWRQLDKALGNSPGIRYVAMGRSLDDDTNAERLMELWSSAVAV